MEYGYIHVSTKEQQISKQLLSLKAFGVTQRNLYMDKQLDDGERPAYQKLLMKLAADDTLVLPNIECLGRNNEEILEQWKFITKKRKAAIVVLDMPFLDTRLTLNDVTELSIAELTLQILSYMVKTERKVKRERQRVGIDAAKARGVQMGRPAKPKPDNFNVAYELYTSGAISSVQAAELLGVSRNTFSRWMDSMGKNSKTM